MSLIETFIPKATSTVGPDQLRARWEALPQPVRRYLRYAINEQAPAIRAAQLDSKYREFGGFRIPTAVDVSWKLEGGPFSYARFKVTSLEYK